MNGGRPCQILMSVQMQRIKNSSPKITAPIISFWKTTVVDLPAAFAVDTLKFTAQRLQFQVDYLTSVRRCGTVPEMVDVNKGFMRQAVNDYREEAIRLADDVRAALLPKRPS